MKKYIAITVFSISVAILAYATGCNNGNSGGVSAPESAIENSDNTDNSESAYDNSESISDNSESAPDNSRNAPENSDSNSESIPESVSESDLEQRFLLLLTAVPRR